MAAGITPWGSHPRKQMLRAYLLWLGSNPILERQKGPTRWSLKFSRGAILAIEYFLLEMPWSNKKFKNKQSGGGAAKKLLRAPPLRL